MLEENNMDWVSMTDKAIIREIGAYIKHQRLEQNKTQARTAKEAGINRWTLSQIENGESVTLTTLIQILRVLDLLHLFKVFTIDERISPIEYARLKEKKKKRARSKNKGKKELRMQELFTDICIIGGGSGGLTVAAGAAQLGARVVLIEKEKMGGECLNTGCVPSKALLSIAKHAKPGLDYKDVYDYIHAAIKRIEPHDSPAKFEKMGVKVIHGAPEFINVKEFGEDQIYYPKIAVSNPSFFRYLNHCFCWNTSRWRPYRFNDLSST